MTLAGIGCKKDIRLLRRNREDSVAGERRRRHTQLRKLWVFCGCLLFAGVLLSGCSRSNRSQDHAPAPDFSLTDLQGNKLQLSAYRGNVVLLDFWATWCAPCRAEIPYFVRLQKQYQAEGLRIIGISLDDDVKPVREFYREFAMNYPVAMGNDKLAQQYGGILGLPVAFVIDRKGGIYRRHIGETDPATFDGDIRYLLQQRQ